MQDIRGCGAVATIAKVSEFIKGVINLRVASRVVGLVVDGVSDVIALTLKQVKAVSEFSSTMG